MDLLFTKVSALMFMEYAVWGAWMPVLAARLLGPLKMNGKQTAWIYATLPLGTMISPLVAGQLADKYVDTGWILAVAHLLGALLLFAASRIDKFGPLFVVMLLYSMFYGATIGLVNAVMMRHIPEAQWGSIFIWAPVAWALIGYMLTGWRMTRKTEGDGSDCLVLAAGLSLIMAAVCLFQPATPPLAQAGDAAPMFGAFAMLGDLNFLIFILASLVISGMMQFYFLGTAQLMQDRGIAPKVVPGAMAIAQVAQAVGTLFLLVWFYQELGPKWTLVVGGGCWLLMYVVYVTSKSHILLVAIQSLHGLAYMFFIIVGQMFTNDVADPAIVASAQALIILVTTGIGLFLGTQLAGLVMDRYSVDGKFQWEKVYMVPLLCMAAGTLALVLGVSDPQPADATDQPAVEAQEEGAVTE